MLQAFQKIKIGMNTKELLGQLEAQPDLWGKCNLRQEHEGLSHKHTKTIYLRWAKQMDIKSVFSDLKAIPKEDYSKLPGIDGILASFMEAVRPTKLGRVIVVKLAAGESIAAHADEGPYADHYERFHLCLTANPETTFHVKTGSDEGETCQMRPGELYWFNHKLEHKVVNEGDQDRIHVIIDACVPEYKVSRPYKEVRSPSKKVEGITFGQESFSKVFSDGYALFEAHWKEVSHYQDILLEVSAESYLKLESSGGLIIYTARDKDGILIGYAFFMVKNNIRYMSSKQALQDIIYISKERRGFGTEFIGWCDEQLKAAGVQAVYHHVKKEHNWGRILEGLGYELVDHVYGRRLD